MPNPPTFPYAFTCPTHGAVHSRTPEPCCGNALPVHAVCDGTEPRLTGMDVLAASMAEADARVRALAKGWIARGESAAMPSPFVARGREVLAALDGTDGGGK